MSEIKVFRFDRLPEDTAGVDQVLVDELPDTREFDDGYVREQFLVFGSGISVVPRSGLIIESFYDFVCPRNDRFLIQGIEDGAFEPTILRPIRDLDPIVIEDIPARLAIAASLFRGLPEPGS